jgi:60 kDa SS-A/Ro ribonucleoprotein
LVLPWWRHASEKEGSNMGTMQNVARAKSKAARKPSNKPTATQNRAGGVAFEISDPALKLVTMTGGAFFAEPKFYNAENCVPKRLAGGKFEKLEQRLQIVKDKLESFAPCEELDEVAREVVATAVDVAAGDKPEDLLAIANWLRNEMNIRLTPQVLLVVASKMDNTKSLVRRYAPYIVKRPDEVKTCLLVFRFMFGMKSLPNGLNYGLGDALAKFGERGLVKYDSPDFPKWSDVLQWLKRKKDWPVKDAVAKYFITGKIVDPKAVPLISARKALAAKTEFDAEAKALAVKSKVNWEVLRSQFKNDAKAVWEYLVEKDLLGYMAMLRNLRNILQAGVNRETIEKVSVRISDRKVVLKSKQLPFRFLSAYKSIDGRLGDTADRNELAAAVELASNYACENVSLPGVTAIFADVSGSMSMSPVSGKSTVTCMDAANVLCGIVAKACERPYVYAFATDTREVRFTKNDTVLGVAGKIGTGGVNGHNTNAWKIPLLLKEKGLTPDRVIILSDMQTWNDSSMSGINSQYARRGEAKAVCDTWAEYVASSAKAKDTWLHCVHLRGYGDTVVDEGSRVNQVAGFSEKVFGMLLKTEGVSGAVDGDDGEGVPTVEQIRQDWTVSA